MREVEEVYLPLTRLINLLCCRRPDPAPRNQSVPWQKRAQIPLYHRGGGICCGWQEHNGAYSVRPAGQMGMTTPKSRSCQPMVSYGPMPNFERRDLMDQERLS